MKVLTINMLHFKLPDDFEGGLSDALRSMANYHDAVKGEPIQSIESVPPPLDNKSMSFDGVTNYAWGEFLRCVYEDDRRLFGLLSISEVTDQSTELLDLN